MKHNRLFFSQLACLGFLIALLAGGCSSAPPPGWMEATDYGVMPTYRKPAEARAKAREVATAHARQQLFDIVCRESIDGGMTVGQLALTNVAFQSKLSGMISGARPEEILGQPQGVVAIRVGVDKEKVLEMARKHMPRPSAAGFAAPITAAPNAPVQPTPAPAPAAPSENAPAGPAIPAESAGAPIQWK